MEISIKCPDCGKTLKVTVVAEETPQTEIIRRVSTPTTWDEIAGKIKAGKASEFLSVGDIVPFTMKDGQTVNAVVAEIDPYGDNEVAFVIEECLDESHVMNEEYTNAGGWRDCDMRKYLNGEILDLLPDDLKAVIADRTITQEKDGEELTSTDKLWLLSLTEVGEDYETDKGDVHFSLFKDERSRVKQQSGETVWYWLRSPNAANSTNFCGVNATGTANNGNADANSSTGVAFGFLIK